MTNTMVALQLSMDAYRRVLDARVFDGKYPLLGTFLLPRHRNTQSPKRLTFFELLLEHGAL